MGTLDEHKEFVEIIEAIFSNLAYNEMSSE
jgi:hypothetical protein